MKRLRRCIRTEMDVEFLSCVHAVTLIFMYGFLRWLVGKESISFAVLTEMLVLGYVMSWTQKLLFIREKAYESRAYQLREALWCLLPVLYTPVSGTLFGWFDGQDFRLALGFYLFMAVYFIMIWIFLKSFYWEDTQELNRMLRNRKKEEHENDGCD